MSSFNFPPPPNENEGNTGAAVVITLVIILVIVVVSCYCGVKMKQRIVSELKAAVAPPTSSSLQVWVADAPTMERFFLDLARDQPFRFTAQQMFTFTDNYSTVLGSGGFGKVETRELEWKKLHEIAIGTAKGIAYLHEECQQRIIHYDIKPGNVLLDSNFNPKVADFGLAKLCNRDDTHVSMTGCRGTPGYLAPEFMLKNFPITYKCDVYSFGILLFEIVGRRRNAMSRGDSESLNWFPKKVWEEYEKGELMALVEACEIEEKDRITAERAGKVALWCVQDSPNARPTMSAVVKMLEGGVEVMPPPKPFNYLFPVGTSVLKRPSGSGSESEYSTSDTANSYWYKETTTPTMSRYEIQVASTS
ncbi:hypothetical protein SASPL_101634 [Salvia splendens]|uniref:Protein kinase domain-containing protein n=1 Tax=Salvia splendens TaxID=180675 RepID=A0A8X8YUB6_SALSN|nr:hypothetical protein SASPL_101634 [Salvia splendens]